VDRPSGHQMPAQRRRIQQLPVRIALAQHPPSFSHTTRKREHPPADLLSSLLAPRQASFALSTGARIGDSQGRGTRPGRASGSDPVPLWH
jgi:hypothetical protein